MKKLIVVLVIIGLLITTPIFAQEKPTRLYTPVTKQATYTAAQTNTTIWTPTAYDSIVCSGYIISTNRQQPIIISASDTVVHLYATSSPIVSPASFLWKGLALETLRITTTTNDVSVTLFGWEEDN